MKRKFGFKGRMSSVTGKRKRGRTYGYLTIPNNIEIFQLEKNTCKVEMDILPYEVTLHNHPDQDIGAEKGVYWFKRPFLLHRNVGVNHASIVCPTSFGNPCPICEYKRKLYKTGGNEDEISEIRVSKRNLYAIIVKRVDDQKFTDSQIQLFEFSDKLFEEVLEEQLEEDENLETFALPDEGSTVYVRFSEDSFGTTKYAKATRFELIERDKQYDESILDLVPKLDECINVLDYDAIKNLFFNVVEDDDYDDDYDDEDDDEDIEEKEEVPRTKKSLRIDADENEIQTDDTKEDERKPRRRSRKIDDVDTRCPFGHVFGKDYDSFEDCDDCDVWRDCRKENRN